jgi:hypothetical protein
MRVTNHLFGGGGKCEATEEQISVYCVKDMNSTAFPSSENSYAACSSLNGEDYHSASKLNISLETW